MTIAELAEQLEVHINTRMEKLSKLGSRVKELQEQATQSQKEMYTLIQELEPVESLVKLQHPNLEGLIDALKSAYEAPVYETKVPTTDKKAPTTDKK